MQDEALKSLVESEGAAAPEGGQTHPQMWAVNLVSDPIHGYIELTKRLTPEHARRLGLAPEAAAEGDLLDSAWLQRMRRISQLQSARWVFPTAEHSRFTHSLGVMHEAGLWARHLYPSLRAALAAAESGAPARQPKGWSSRRSGWPDSSTTWATGRSRTSSTSTSCAASPRRPTRAGRTRASRTRISRS